MYVKPNPERKVVVHQGGQIIEGRVVGGKAAEVGVDVHHPHTRQPLPSSGMEVPEDPYWMRRLRDGDLVLSEPPAPVSEVAAEREAAEAVHIPAIELEADPAPAEEHAA